MRIFKHSYESYDKYLFYEVEILQTSKNCHKTLKFSFSFKYLFNEKSF